MKKSFLFLLNCFSGLLLTAQVPFQEEIDAFKKADSIKAPLPGSILFVGSSSFRKWQDVQAYFPGYRIINRGFGGSTLPDLIHFAPDVIYAYKPSQIVIYCGDNDLAVSDTVTAQIVLKRFKQLFGMIRHTLGEVPVAYVSIKPSPSRWRLEHVINEANHLIAQFMARQRKATFIDIHRPMLRADGIVNGALFTSDSLHMNEKGYKLWQGIIRPHLKKG